MDVQNPPLPALRLAAGLALAEIAAATGMAYSTYYRLQNGLVRANPHPETTDAVAHALGRGTTVILRAIAQTRLSQRQD